MNKLSVIILFLIISIHEVNAQYFTVKDKHVIYKSGKGDSDSSRLSKYAQLINHFINTEYKEYKNETNPYIILRFLYRESVDTNYFDLDIENIENNSFRDDIFLNSDSYGGYGLRIHSYLDKDYSEEILKLIEYGILHLKELTSLWGKYNKAHDSGVDYDPIYISQDTITQIIYSSPSKKVKRALKKFH